MERNYIIDLFKGLAVFIMIFANTSPYFFNLNDHLIIRFLFSLAAPVFIICSGYITQKNLSNLEIKKSKLLFRFFQILFFAAFIDFFFWHSIPFITFDVLYLIGFSQLFLFIINKKYLIHFLFFTLLISILLHNSFIYRFDINEVKLFSLNTLFDENPLKRLFFDGWFPIFPWLTFFMLGSLSSEFTSSFIKYKKPLILSSFFLIVFFFIKFNNITFEVRENYLELFYPLNSYALLIPSSVFLLFVGTLNSTLNNNNIFINFIINLGKNTLLIYVLNALIIAYVSDNSLNLNLSSTEKALSFCLVISILLIISVLFERLKKTNYWIKTPKAIKFILCN